MTVSFSDFITLLSQYPLLFVASLLIIGVIIVNGWTDAPNSLTAIITTRAMKPEKAIFMAVFLNFLGVFFITMVDAKVAYSIFTIADFKGNLTHSLVALCATQIAIIIWSVLAWYFGLPISHSHALIAGLTGSSISLHQSLEGINTMEWIKVLYGMVGSTFFGFLAAFILTKCIHYHFYYRDRREISDFFTRGQIIGSASMAFLHGAQSGQKFMGVFLLALTLSHSSAGVNHLIIPVWLVLICSFALAYGTSLGGLRVIRSVGVNMVQMKKYEGFSSDIGASIIIFISTLFGIPVSTTHIKMSSFVGVGMARRFNKINWSIVFSIVLAWLLTFPVCGFIGYFMTNIFIRIF